MATPTTAPAVKTYLGLTDGADDAAIGEVVDAVNDLMSDWFELDVWPKRKCQGATMLAARVYRRRNSPSGVESLGELGPVYVSRNDPDIAQLLGLGHYARPVVG